MNNKKRKEWSTRKRIVMGSIGVFALIYIAVILYNTYRPLPEGVSYKGEMHSLDNVTFLTDLTFADDQKGTNRRSEQEIFEHLYQMIDEANDFIVLDMFLMDGYNDDEESFPKIAETLSSKLAEKKKENPDMKIVYITDPINKGYGSYESKWFDKLDEAGVEIVYTDLDKLRDSTPIYSGVYRIFFQWFETGTNGWIKNLMADEAPDMTAHSYLKLLNIKANHRKVVITDKEALVTSSNPHNASGLHGNIALAVNGPIMNDILEAEEAVSIFSGGPKLPRVDAKEQKGEYKAQYVTERKILKALLKDIEATKKGDTIRLEMFFVAKRDIVNALVDASNRGVDVKMILDPNANSFGQEKSGLPNRPMAQELMEDSQNKIDIRWYNTVVGQYHTKMIMIQTDEKTVFSSGSANYTERTLDDYNLEANLRVEAPNDSKLVNEMTTYFDRLWNNEDAMYTLDVEEYQDDFTFWQRWIYTIQKILKVTTY
ncbi:phospholipase D family protein [Paenisporosarcina cavernae]|uniref:Phospholipase n=1 Tax=Paenisporosarcina cavernae TaxID=2320858 RepID=A0A385YRX2_9BACL|nr:phospholipase D family protein [Paenisporosarcina cavernae]AYC28747.1 phospholipase [Paenisporosarcina cavernae]